MGHPGGVWGEGDVEGGGHVGVGFGIGDCEVEGCWRRAASVSRRYDGMWEGEWEHVRVSASSSCPGTSNAMETR